MTHPMPTDARLLRSISHRRDADAPQSEPLGGGGMGVVNLLDDAIMQGSILSM